MEISKRLWWPTKTDWRGSEQSSSSGLRIEQAHASSMKIITVLLPNRSLLQTSWQSSTYSLAGRMEKEDTGKLTSAEKKKRSVAYKGISPEEKKFLKSQLGLTKGHHVMRARLWKIKLDNRQSAWMKRWFKDANWTYNVVIREILARNLHHTESMKTLNVKALEAEFVKRFVAAKQLTQMRSHWFRIRTPKVI